MKVLPFSIDEVNAITRLSQVDRYMQRHCGIESHKWDVPNFGGHNIAATTIYIDRSLTKWGWLGQPIPVSRFVILREKYTMALIDALRDLEGRELGELLSRVWMVDKNDCPFEHAYSVGLGAVNYAVKLQYGASGLRSFERFTESEAKTLAHCANLPPDLRRMPL
jgi:hypothetical protein